jgi:hypothetical protein
MKATRRLTISDCESLNVGYPMPQTHPILAAQKDATTCLKLKGQTTVATRRSDPFPWLNSIFRWVYWAVSFALHSLSSRDPVSR